MTTNMTGFYKTWWQVYLVSRKGALILHCSHNKLNAKKEESGDGMGRGGGGGEGEEGAALSSSKGDQYSCER